MRKRSRMLARASNSAGSRMEPESQLTDELWSLIEDLFPVEDLSPLGGRPPYLPRPCLEGILWVLRTGARWKDLPQCFPSPSTCWRRFRDWTESGVWQMAWARLLYKLDGLGQVNWEEAMADGMFSPAKKGGNASATPSVARALRRWSLRTATACHWPRRSPAPVPPR